MKILLILSSCIYICHCFYIEEKEECSVCAEKAGTDYGYDYGYDSDYSDDDYGDSDSSDSESDSGDSDEDSGDSDEDSGDSDDDSGDSDDDSGDSNDDSGDFSDDDDKSGKPGGKDDSSSEDESGESGTQGGGGKKPSKGGGKDSDEPDTQGGGGGKDSDEPDTQGGGGGKDSDEPDTQGGGGGKDSDEPDTQGGGGKKPSKDDDKDTGKPSTQGGGGKKPSKDDADDFSDDEDSGEPSTQDGGGKKPSKDDDDFSDDEDSKETNNQGGGGKKPGTQDGGGKKPSKDDDDFSDDDDSGEPSTQYGGGKKPSKDDDDFSDDDDSGEPSTQNGGGKKPSNQDGGGKKPSKDEDYKDSGKPSGGKKPSKDDDDKDSSKKPGKNDGHSSDSNTHGNPAPYNSGRISPYVPQKCIGYKKMCLSVSNIINLAPTKSNAGGTYETEIKDYGDACFSREITMKDNGNFEDCCDVKANCPSCKSGYYRIWPKCSDHPANVYCDLSTANGCWTVIQRRTQQPKQENFYRSWDDYKNGFGDIRFEYWLGNDILHALTSCHESILLISLIDFQGISRNATYKSFKVASENMKYQLTVGKYSGDAGDAFSAQNSAFFHTFDTCNDVQSSEQPGLNCCEAFKGCWWYFNGGCHNANLNGYNYGGNMTTYADGICWKFIWGYRYSLEFTEMKIMRTSS